MSQTFHGIYPMLYAFFKPDNSLDRDAHRRQVGACIAAGAHGLAVGGLATECNKLSTDEKRQLVEWTIEDVADQVPISVTVSENTLAGQRNAIDHAHSLGVSWVVMQPPPVRGASLDALVEFFATVANGFDLPLGVQNAPEYIGVGLDNSAIRTLADHAPNIQILKAEGPAPYIGGLMQDLGKNFTVFNGRNGVELIDNLRAGCAGTIPGVECCDLQIQIYNSWRSGDHSVATTQFRQALPLLSYLMLTIDHLLCYGKRLAAQRLGITQVYDRQPAMAATPVDLDTLDFWSRDLGPLPEL